VARVPRRRSAPLRPARATERAERSAAQAERSAAAHGVALPTLGTGTGRGDTGPRRCGGNHAHSTKRPVPVRRADRPAITVRTARSAAGTGRRGPSRAPFGAGARPGPRAGRFRAGPENDRAPAVSGEGSIDRARCGQPPMRNIFVPQTGQVPWVAGLPFFIVIFCASFISRFALHFTQYASATPGASLSSRWTSSGPSPGARPLRAIQVRRSHLVRIRRTRQIRGGANSRNGSPRRIGASSRFPRDWVG
jgi:hypothetical protein